MKKKYLVLIGLCPFLFFGNGYAQKSPISPYETQINKLLSHMTLQEKVGQMAQITLDVIGQGNDLYSSNFPFRLDTAMMHKVFDQYKVGSVLNSPTNTPLTPEQWRSVIKSIQQQSMKAIGIPCLYGIDAIHGSTYVRGATFYPQEIGQGATFNSSLIKACAQMSATETRAADIPWSFSPVLDMGRDPRWPRMWETFGEDPYLTSMMGVATVEGYQGTDKNKITNNHVAACLKHYVGYGATFNGHDREPGFIPQNELMERHLKPFAAAVKAGALSVMVNSGIINGVSVHSNKHYITDILKHQLRFDGVVVTDWADINNLCRRDKIVANQKEAVKIAINAGIDMSMIPYDLTFCTDLQELVKEHQVSMARIDDAVRRILRLKYRLGLFQLPQPNTFCIDNFASDDHHKLAKQTALESITLLKNNQNILPLTIGKKILVTGPNANSMRTLDGGWTLSWQGEKADKYETNHNTILKAIQDMDGKEYVSYVPGVTYNNRGKYDEENTPDFQAVIDAANKADVIVACVGENSYTEKPGDLNDLYLSDNQQQLIRELSKTGKPIVLVLNEGRPRIISKIEPLAQAVVQTYLPGSFGGEALADILFGCQNPSGRLPYTYPRYPNSLMNYDYKPAQQQAKMAGAYDYQATSSVQYPFGYGMSYTSFAYSNLRVIHPVFHKNDIISISVDVTNIGQREGKESVILYVSDLLASITPDNKRVRAFDKINLKPGQMKTVVFHLHPSELAFADQSGHWILEPGNFKIKLGQLEKNITYRP